MLIKMLSSKIHRARVTEADLNYIGSITIDAQLLQAAGLHEFQQVEIANINTGARFTTYVMKGEPGTGTLCLNGAAARKAQPGDLLIIMGFALMTEEEAAAHQPRIVHVDEHNRLI